MVDSQECFPGLFMCVCVYVCDCHKPFAFQKVCQDCVVPKQIRYHNLIFQLLCTMGKSFLFELMTYSIHCLQRFAEVISVRSPAKIDLYLNNNNKLLPVENGKLYILSWYIIKEYLQGKFFMEETFNILQCCSSSEFSKHPRKGNRELPYWTEVTMTVLWRKLGLFVSFLSSTVADVKHYGK